MMTAAIEIPALLARYSDAFDGGDFAAAAALFDGGCVVVEGGEVAGREAIASLWESYVHIYDDGTPRTRHLVSNPAINLSADGRRAECRSQWTVLQQLPGEPLKLVGSGRYHDEFCLERDEWRFAKRTYGRVDFWGDTSDHLKMSPLTKGSPDGDL